MAALPGRSSVENGDELAMTPARNSPASSFDPDDVTGKALGTSGAYIYGYDPAGNPTLTEAGCDGSSDGKVPD